MGIQRLIVKCENGFWVGAKPRWVDRRRPQKVAPGGKSGRQSATALLPLRAILWGGIVLLIALAASTGALILSGRWLLRLAGQPDQRQRLLVHLAGRLQPRSALEPAQGSPGARTKNSIHLAGVESIVVERLLQLPDLVLAEIDRGTVLACAGLRLRRHISLLRQRRKRHRKRQGDESRENKLIHGTLRLLIVDTVPTPAFCECFEISFRSEAAAIK